jgi:glycosyltransferase involved in cell wall biosynthesis
MKLGFVGLEDPQSIRSYSGTPYCMAGALKRQGCEISFFLKLKERDAALVNLKNKMTRVITGRHIICERNPRVVRHYPDQINAAARRHQVDAVLGTSSFYMINRNCPVPSIFWGDTTVAGVLNRYPYYKHLTRRSIRDCNLAEQQALDSCALAVFSSQWAADVACASYDVDTRKVRVIPYGANLSTSLNVTDIATCLRRRDESDWELLFVGIDWERKGAQIAVDTTSALRARGINARLTLVGCVPPRTVRLPDYVTVIGRIDKSTLKGQALLSALYMQSHLLILPSRAECAAVSLAEASAHGVPSLATNVGGNSTLVRDGVNGFLLPLEAGPMDYAEHTLQLLSDPAKYTELCWSSFQRFQTELNWDVSVSKLITEINGVLNLTDGQYACSRAS